MSKIWMIGACVMALSVAGAMAEGEVKAEKKAPAPKPELKELTLEGVVNKIENKKKDGTVTTALKLVMDDGSNVMLPKGKPGKDSPAASLESAIGLRVKVVGMGFEMEKKGKKVYGLRTITSAAKVEVPAAAAAAPTN